MASKSSLLCSHEPGTDPYSGTHYSRRQHDANISHTFHSKVVFESDKMRRDVSHNTLQKITTGNVRSSWSVLRYGNEVMQI